MAIQFQLLGRCFHDNALWVSVDTGQSIHRFLFDCGQNVLEKIPISQLQQLDHLFFSHFHMDHIAGFDAFLRVNYARGNKDVHLWGPQKARSILLHRLRGISWNLVANEQFVPWNIHEIRPRTIQSTHYYANEAFQTTHNKETSPYSKKIVDHNDFTVEAIVLDHKIPCIGYLIQEKTKWNIDKQQLRTSSLPSGPWLKQLKNPKISNSNIISIENKTYPLGKLRGQLLTPTKTETIAYLSDFIMSPSTKQKLKQFLPNDSIIVCESQYHPNDIEQAQKNHHLTSNQAATLAKETQAKQLILFHLSARYSIEQVKEMLNQAQEIFPNTKLPEGWH